MSRSNRRTFLFEDTNEEVRFILVLDVEDFLSNIFTRAANTTNSQEDVLVEKILCESLCGKNRVN